MALNDPETFTYDRRAATGANALVRDHMTLVRKIAWHVHGRVSSAVEVEDLMQTGMVALIEAARTYEDRGFAFATYAAMRIRGGMIDSLRKNMAQCRSAMATRRTIAQVRARFEQMHGRAPGDRDMAQAMGMELSEYQAAAEASQGVHHESIDDLYSDHSMWFADLDEGADVALERSELAAAIATAIKTLPEREAMVLQLYFVEEMNLDEIGATMGVGAARVCQIKKSALDKVRTLMTI